MIPHSAAMIIVSGLKKLDLFGMIEVAFITGIAGFLAMCVFWLVICFLYRREGKKDGAP